MFRIVKGAFHGEFIENLIHIQPGLSQDYPRIVYMVYMVWRVVVGCGMAHGMSWHGTIRLWHGMAGQVM